jgi:4-hydroxybenzoate polyprenyltransferase
VARALAISRAMHVVTIVGLMALAWVTPLPPFYFAGVGVIALLLIYEQSLVRADDLSQVKRAFDMNGYVGILYLLVLAISVWRT